jgi:peptidoglycan/LPS O-acetylase OafA/YrhL
MVCIYEHNEVKRWALVCFIVLVFAHFFWRGPLYQPLWKEDHHALIALGLFLGAWRFRHHLTSGPLTRWLSDLTYPVYLFHNWFYFILLYKLTVWFGWNQPLAITVSLVVLLGLCLLASAIVEKPFVRLGRRLVQRMR